MSRSLLERPLVYRLWQAPFAERKFAPVLAHNDLPSVRRVLDVACGPGTNARHFPGTFYLGVDLNTRYLADARRRLRRPFVAADAARLPLRHGCFDFVLVNSFFHHVDTPTARVILASLREALSENGHIHVLDLALPNRPGVARLLARLDRGKFARPLAEWRVLFSEQFEPLVFEPYSLGVATRTLWHMVYFKGRPRHA